MVRFEIEDYCENCKEIDPEVQFRADLWSDKGTMIRDTLIKCKKHEICAAMWKDLKVRCEQKDVVYETKIKEEHKYDQN